ncbi:hypothetical protein CASFOL_015517 [Castilleja foliolosa]|uniref:Uncharacterized protein n=1 Tax=Castilleja foliolosa TaxID=1961234 RepID=A0ABD3DHE5_9LAMI
MENYMNTRDMIRWKSGKKLDPNLVTLLELFGEIYTERHEFFKKIFHGKHEEEVFQKVDNVFKRKKTMKKARSMTRSLSMRAINRRGIDDDLRLERFKIKTPNVMVAEPGEEGSSNDSK